MRPVRGRAARVGWSCGAQDSLRPPARSPHLSVLQPCPHMDNGNTYAPCRVVMRITGDTYKVEVWTCAEELVTKSWLLVVLLLVRAPREEPGSGRVPARGASRSALLV